VVKVNQRVKVRVLAVDLERNRISLSMKQPGSRPEKREKMPKAKKPVAGPVPQKKAKPGPFNNPFADAFRK
jgi:protein Tex